MYVVVVPYLLFEIILSIRRYDAVIDCTLQCTLGFECDIAIGLQHSTYGVSSAFASCGVNLTTTCNPDTDPNPNTNHNANLNLCGAKTE